jgi:hypothetical protein
MFGITTSYPPQARPRLEVVTLDSIVATVEARTDFDARLRPASNRIRRRWERIALGHRTGRARVSVARALGQRDIEAWVGHPGSSR